jgi:phospholipid/cholesterol/gamma-HCH transport system substrate-binding protein
MNISKEVKTGILVVISVAALAIGSSFLKGMNVFSSDKTYICYFENVQGLTPAATISIKGLVVGNVSEITLQGNEKVKVELSINKKIAIPQGTIASIYSPDLMSGKAIKLELGSGSTNLNNNDIITSAVELGAIDKITTSIEPAVGNINAIMLRLDSITTAIQYTLNPELQRNVQNSVASLETTMKNFASLSSSLNRESESLAGILRNTNKITNNFASNSQNIDEILSNLKTTSHSLSNADIETTVKELQNTLHQTQLLLDKINKGEGSLGMLANDKNLYNNLSKSMNSLDYLLDDLKKRPSRYINIRLFGKAPKDDTK